MKRHMTLLLAVLLVVILVCAIFYVYEVPVLSVWNLASVLICIGTFWFCGMVRKKKLEGTIAMTVYVVVVFVLFSKLSMGSDFGTGFGRWFFSGADIIDTQLTYLLALLVGFPVFFSLTIYYFTQIRYRMSILTLISLIPCVLYVKITAEIDNIFLILIAMCNVAIVLAKVHETQKQKVKRIGGHATIASAAVFVFVLLFMASAIPKEKEAPYYDVFENLFMDGNVTLELDSDFSDLNDYSGNADNGAEFENRRMYVLYGNTSTYLKRQTFDYYDFEYDRWYGDEEYSNIEYQPDYYKEEQEKLSLSKLQKAVAEAEEIRPGFVEKYGLENIYHAGWFQDSVCRLSVHSQNFGAQYYLAPSRCIAVENAGYGAKLGVTKGGVFRSEKEKHDEYTSYDIVFYDEYESRYRWFELGGADYDNGTASDMLEELHDITKTVSSNSVEVAWAFYNQQADADSYREMCKENNESISKKIRNLAQEITKDCKYDWEKANALQEYFFYNDFTYDMSYMAKDTSPEYFLFESKTGTCSDFASAYVLMARSLGLTVRYAEGYVPENALRSNMYTIADKNSHAYPEVFIQNMGWIIFEPTMPSRYVISNEQDSKAVAIDLSFLSELDMDYKLMFVIAVAAFAALCLAWILTVLVPFVDERVFMLRIRGAVPSVSVIIIYKRMLRKTLAKLVPGAKCLTPYEVAGQIEQVMACQVYELAFVTEKTLYGGYVPTEDEKRMVVEAYVQVKRTVRKAKKRRRKSAWWNKRR